MNANVKQLEQWMRASGIDCLQITDATTGQLGLFVHFDDATKKQHQQICSMAKRLKVRMDVSDKGPTFFPFNIDERSDF